MSNLLSFSSLKLDIFSKEGVRLKPASGFVVEAHRQYYLITNRHVVSGRDLPEAEQQKSAIEPYMLKTSVHIYGGIGEKSARLDAAVRKRITVPLYDDEGTPRWMESQAHKQRQSIVDIVALRIQLNMTLELFSGKTPGTYTMGSWSKMTDYWTKVSALPISGIDTDVEYGPADAVHIIGYPLGWAPEGIDRSSSAFWRTSFVASEIYEAGMTRSDVFFVDPCAPEGMTGSPVVGLKNNRMKLLGVYSDRSTAEFGANAGFVSGAWLLKELIGAS